MLGRATFDSKTHMLFLIPSNPLRRSTKKNALIPPDPDPAQKTTKVAQGRPRWLKGSPRAAQREPKGASRSPKSRQRSPKDDQWDPRASKGSQKEAKVVPREAEGAPKASKGIQKDGWDAERKPTISTNSRSTAKRPLC